MDLNGKVVLVTGGTGSFGKKFTEIVTKEYSPKKLIIFSRDELKQSEMQMVFNAHNYPGLRYFIGDVRDRDRLYRALDGVDVVVHAAALKQVVAAEYNPFEVIKTNILGAQNVIDAAIDQRVERVIALSTDKAASPVNLYGATKLCSDKLFVAANSYVGSQNTRFCVVRYGNVVGSRGSVIPLFLKQRDTGKITITDKLMTRFWITLEQGVRFVIQSLEGMIGGEIFIPKLPSVSIMDLIKAIAPNCECETIGIRPGEKLHEVMIPRDEARNAIDYGDFFVIEPPHAWWYDKALVDQNCGIPCSKNFEYSSDTNDVWLSIEEIKNMANNL